MRAVFFLMLGLLMLATTFTVAALGTVMRPVVGPTDGPFSSRPQRLAISRPPVSVAALFLLRWETQEISACCHPLLVHGSSVETVL